VTTLYKTFSEGRIGPHSRKEWPKRIGAWVEVEGPLVVCENGIHVARGEVELLEWLAPEVYEVEVRGERIDADEKACVRACRLVRRVDALNDRTLRLFAADCAERALAHVESPDSRSLAAVQAARGFAEGRISRVELDAAWAAAWAATWAAARAAEREWQAERLRYYINGEEAAS
jgi:hypothetical protein